MFLKIQEALGILFCTHYKWMLLRPWGKWTFAITSLQVDSTNSQITPEIFGSIKIDHPSVSNHGYINIYTYGYPHVCIYIYIDTIYIYTHIIYIYYMNGWRISLIFADFTNISTGASFSAGFLLDHWTSTICKSSFPPQKWVGVARRSTPPKTNMSMENHHF